MILKLHQHTYKNGLEVIPHFMFARVKYSMKVTERKRKYCCRMKRTHMKTKQKQKKRIKTFIQKIAKKYNLILKSLMKSIV